jgi:hypothetical protein
MEIFPNDFNHLFTFVNSKFVPESFRLTGNRNGKPLSECQSNHIGIELQGVMVKEGRIDGGCEEFGQLKNSITGGSESV